MAKVRPLQNAPRTAYGTRGVYVLSGTKHGIVASKWPKPRGKATQGYDFYRQTEFGLVASMVASPNPYDYGTAVEMAKGTEQVPRDILMMAAMGTYYRFQFKNGDIWEGYRTLQPNVQSILDQLGAGPGALIWRAPVGWVSLEIPAAGKVLTSDGFQPRWEDPQGGGGDAAPARMTYHPTITGDGRNARTMGARYKPRMPMSLTHLGAYLGNHPDETIVFSVWSMAGNALDIKLAETLPVTAPAGGDLYIEGQLDATAELLPGVNYALLATQDTGASIPNDLVTRSNERPQGAMLYDQQGNMRTSTYPLAPGTTMTLDNDWRVMIAKGTW